MKKAPLPYLILIVVLALTLAPISQHVMGQSNKAMHISFNSTNQDGYWNNVLLMWGNYGGAVPAFVKLLSITPKDSAALDDEGLSLYQLGNHTALKFFDKAIALNKTDTNAYYNKALVLQTWGNYSGAIDNYNKELAVDKQLGLKPDPDALSNKKLAVEALFATARLP